jgi:hypothetical protein
VRGRSTAAALAVASVLFFFGADALAEDPLDTVDGTEGWGEIDTSAVDAAAAWRAWRRDLRRWEAGRARLARERVRMERVRGEGGEEEPPVEDPADAAAHQARVDAARRTARSGGPDQRDSTGQVIDDERPWRRR